jgi:hypothetical protein
VLRPDAFEDPDEVERVDDVELVVDVPDETDLVTTALAAEVPGIS